MKTETQRTRTNGCSESSAEGEVYSHQRTKHKDDLRSTLSLQLKALEKEKCTEPKANRRQNDKDWRWGGRSSVVERVPGVNTVPGPPS